MFRSNAISLVSVLATLVLLLTAPGIQTAAQGQSLRGLSCDELWYARNAIFADKGYCFKTRRARSVFGAACFPPYGRLSGAEQRQVDRIRNRERQLGCSGGDSTTRPVSAYSAMSCGQLWYARNEVFARNGYCFKMARGRASFGANCFPPYGKLGRADQRIVDRIRSWERRKGCR